MPQRPLVGHARNEFTSEVIQAMLRERHHAGERVEWETLCFPDLTSGAQDGAPDCKIVVDGVLRHIEHTLVGPHAQNQSLLSRSDEFGAIAFDGLNALAGLQLRLHVAVEALISRRRINLALEVREWLRGNRENFVDGWRAEWNGVGILVRRVDLPHSVWAVMPEGAEAAEARHRIDSKQKKYARRVRAGVQYELLLEAYNSVQRIDPIIDTVRAMGAGPFADVWVADTSGYPFSFRRLFPSSD